MDLVNRFLRPSICPCRTTSPVPLRPTPIWEIMLKFDGILITQVASKIEAVRPGTPAPMPHCWPAVRSCSKAGFSMRQL